MSIVHTEDLECPSCKTKNQVRIWTSLNAQVDPEAKELLLIGKINIFECIGCGEIYPVAARLLYHDMENHFLACYFPVKSIENDNFLDQFAESGQLDLDKDINPENNLGYAKNVHYCLSMGELARYIMFRENLAKRNSLIGITCCACGRNINRKEHFLRVLRILQEKSKGRHEPEDSLLSWVTSIQLCEECVIKSASEDIIFRNPPFPLMHLEKRRFLQYTRVRIHLNKHLDVATDRCGSCLKEICRGDKYMRLQVSEQLPEGEVVEIEDENTIGVLCHECTEKYAWGSFE